MLITTKSSLLSRGVFVSGNHRRKHALGLSRNLTSTWQYLWRMGRHGRNLQIFTWMNNS